MSASLVEQPQPVLRDAKPSDAGAIARIYNASLPARAAAALDATRPLSQSVLQPLDIDGIQRWMQYHQHAGRPLWTAVGDGQPVGWLSLGGFADRPGCRCTAEVSIYLAPEWQRRGLGSTLLRHAIAQAPRWHIDRLLGFIWHDNAASRALFHRHGFEPLGRLPDAIWAEGVSRDMLIVGLKLPASSPRA